MIRSICLWIAQFCVRQVRSWSWPTLLTGGSCGLLLLTSHQQFFSQLGRSQPVSAAACMAIGLAWALAWGYRRETHPAGSRPSLWQWLRLPGLLVAWTIATPWLWNLHDQFLSEDWLASRWTILIYAFSWATVTLGIPVWCVGRLSLLPSDGSVESESRARPSAACLLGISLGLGIGLILPWGGLIVTALTGCLILLGTQYWGYRDAQRTNVSSVTTSDSIPTISSPADVDWGSMLVSLACGGLSLWVARIFQLLFPATIFTLTAVVSGLLFGVACGCRFSPRTNARQAGAALFARCCLIVVVLILAAGFSEVVYRLVTVTGSVSQVWLLHLLRWSLIGGCSAALGLVWASATSRLVGWSVPFNGVWQPQAWSCGIQLALVGGVLSNLVLLPLCGLTFTGYVWLWGIAGVQIIDLVRYRVLPRNTLVRGFALGCLAALIGAPVLSFGVRPELAGRLLFATNVFQADQLGTPRRQLPFLDDARLEVQLPGERGVFTVWKSSFARHQIRENGIPRGSLSTNTQISPQDSSEVVLALLPLTLHERPQRVALLGIGASTPLQTCLSCPIQEVTTVENDPQLISLLQQITSKSEAAAMWQDERVTLRTVDPALWVAGSGETFDVVISNPDPSALVHGASQFTREFYQRAARRLSVDGIFCQRFQYYDYGPRPLQMVAATLRNVFQHVLAVEIGPGEIAWLATNSEAGLVRSEAVDRMGAAHVRDLMAQVGWDWSVLLTLAAYDNERLDKVMAGASSRINTAANGRFCTQLPSELMRWAPKSQEIQQAVTAHAGKILNWVGEAGTDDDLLRRLAEVRGQQELVANYPDQYWGYRSQVRKQISSRPLSRIEQVKHETTGVRSEGVGLHPDDKRRLRYFQQLSKAIQMPNPVEVEKLAQYATPYDPLVSLFMHQELAEIAAHVPELPPSLELTHRLHMLNFSPAFDHSVRNALSGLRLVLEKPECVASNAERWDVINGFLHVLQVRWENRTPADNANARLATRDVEENIVLAERALQELAPLAVEVGFTAEDWDSRQRVIERKLLGPLRDYRERLQPIAAKQRLDAMEAEVDGELPSDEDLQFPGAGSATE